MMINLSKYKGIIFDIDGVIYRGSEILPGVKELLAHLKASHLPFAFLTNNSSKTQEQSVEKFSSIGITGIEPEQLVSSAAAVGGWLKQNATQGASVFVFGVDGLKHEVKKAGFELRSKGPADYLVFGYKTDLKYEDFAEAALVLNSGAKFIAANLDGTMPTERGLLPGTGSLIQVLIHSTGRNPDVVLGKPDPAIFRMALELLNTSPSETLMVGDRIETDILGASRLGMDTAFVLTGVNTKADLELSDVKPSYVLDNLASIL